MSDITKVKYSQIKLKNKSKSIGNILNEIVNESVVENLNNQKNKHKAVKKMSNADYRKGELFDKINKDNKKSKLNQFLNKTIEINKVNFLDDILEKMLTKINRIKTTVKNNPSKISRDFAKTKKFLNIYSARYECISNDDKLQINEEIKVDSNKRTERYNDLLSEVKKNFGLLSDVVNSGNFIIQNDIFESIGQDIKNTDQIKSKIRSNSIVENMMNKDILSKIGKLNTPIHHYNTTSKKKLNTHRSVIIDKEFKNVYEIKNLVHSTFKY